jgi:hypothetical protein
MTIARPTILSAVWFESHKAMGRQTPTSDSVARGCESYELGKADQSPDEVTTTRVTWS